jgi:hypothetical protein
MDFGMDRNDDRQRLGYAVANVLQVSAALATPLKIGFRPLLALPGEDGRAYPMLSVSYDTGRLPPGLENRMVLLGWLARIFENAYGEDLLHIEFIRNPPEMDFSNSVLFFIKSDEDIGQGLRLLQESDRGEIHSIPYGLDDGSLPEVIAPLSAAVRGRVLEQFDRNYSHAVPNPMEFRANLPEALDALYLQLLNLCMMLSDTVLMNAMNLPELLAFGAVPVERHLDWRPLHDGVAGSHFPAFALLLDYDETKTTPDAREHFTNFLLNQVDARLGPLVFMEQLLSSRLPDGRHEFLVPIPPMLVSNI